MAIVLPAAKARRLKKNTKYLWFNAFPYNFSK